MIFLKRVFIHGFKSFASKTNFYFNHQLTAIIGPNGAGKSNFIDAIRWILGDKITKQMRIQNYNDLIFSGSTKDYPPAPFANVKLYFDNSKRIFDYDLNEIILEKIVYRDDFNAETFINRHPVTQKEIVEIMAGFGIVNFGLSFISQNTINQMINYKPEEVKQLLINASGLLQYQKNKTKIYKNLIQTKEKLKSLSIIFQDEVKRFEKLLIEVEKARNFQDLKNELYQKEVIFLVNKINFSLQSLSEHEKELKKLSSSLDQLNDKKSKIKSDFEEYQSTIYQLDQELINTSNDIENINTFLFNLDQEFNLKSTINIDVIKKFLNNLNKKNGDINTKLKNLSSLENDLKIKSQDLEMKIAQNDYQINFLQNQIKKLDFQFEEKFSMCCGKIQDLFTVNPEFQKAVNAALGAKLKYLLVHNNTTAKKIIDYLATNKLFKATFLIFDKIVEQDNRESQKHLFKSLKIDNLILSPFIELISFDKKYFKVFSHLFNKVILTKDFETAQYLKNLLPDFIIVTLDGTVFLKKELIVGGFIKIEQNQSFQTKIKTLKDLNISLVNDQQETIKKLNKIKFEINKLQIEQAEVYKELVKYEYQHSVYQNQKKFQQTPQESPKIQIVEYKEKLRNLNLAFKIQQQKKQQLLEQQNSNFDLLEELELQSEDFSKKIEKLNNSIFLEKLDIKNFSIKLAETYQLTIEKSQELVDSFPKLEPTLQEVETIKEKLSKLGPVNLDSLKVYEEEKERYRLLKEEYENVSKSTYHIESTVAFLDNILKKLFTQFIEQINETLPSIFHKFYKNGKISLKHIENEDLSGIEISAIFPAKKESFFLNNLSGGEKTLVIVCLLLAILKIKKLPLVIFDEVDANLDPVNVSKLGAILNDFSKEIQFILITHRNQLMVHCPILYGATTHGKGVTSIVGINIKNPPLNLVDEIDRTLAEKTEIRS